MQDREASSAQNAANRASKLPRCLLPFPTRSSSGLRVVMAKPIAKKDPPEAGACPRERCQLYVGICRAPGELFRGARPIEPQTLDVIEEPSITCAVF